MKEEDIPVLTQIAGAEKSASKSIPLSANLIAEIIAQIRPQLEDEIEKSVIQKLRKKMQEDILENLHNESANIQKANQAYLASALSQQFDQQSQRFDQRFESIQIEKESDLKAFVTRELTAAQHASHDFLSETVYKEVEQTQQILAAHIKNTVSQELSQAVTSACLLYTSRCV